MSTVPAATTQAASVGIIGGADGPTAVFVTGSDELNIDSIKAEFLDYSDAILGKGFATLSFHSHFTETAAAPTTYRQHHLQVWIRLFKCNHLTKSLWIIDSDSVKGIVHMTESIVNMGHAERIGNDTAPRSYISDHYSVRFSNSCS